MIDDSFPLQGTEQPAYQGSQSSTPLPQADPRQGGTRDSSLESYKMNTDKILGKNRMKDYPYPGDKK